MTFKQSTLFHTTTVGTFVIESLPGTSKEDFVNTLQQALSGADPTSLQRDTNPVSQELLIDETQVDVNTCLWSLRFNGIHAPGVVPRHTEVRERPRGDVVGVHDEVVQVPVAVEVHEPLPL